MRIIFMGTPDFSVLPLKSLASRGKDEIVAVITNPDKPVGRKQVLTPCAVKAAAEKLGLKVYSYNKIRVEGVEDLKKIAPDIIITCAFGQILSKEILDIPKYGVINVHASLLPKYRGASPIHYAIMCGEEKTGITIMKTDEGIDTGDILLKEEVKIGENETCGELFERLSVLGADLLDGALDLIESGKAKFNPQDETKATYTKMIKKEDALINWSRSAKDIKNQIRAFCPAPAAYTFYSGEQIKIFEAEVLDGNGNAGEIIKSDGELVVSCGAGLLKIKSLQKAGGRRMNAAEFLRGNKIPSGGFLGNA